VEDLKALVRRTAQPGRVVWIGLRPGRRAPLLQVERCIVGARGLEGDHGASDKRAVTLLQEEHLAAIGSFLGRGQVAPEDLRRNILVAGINLLSLRDREVRLGKAVLHVTGPCAPCSRMEEALGQGGYAAVRGHGGVTARVVSGGLVVLGDPVMPVD